MKKRPWAPDAHACDASLSPCEIVTLEKAILESDLRDQISRVFQFSE